MNSPLDYLLVLAAAAAAGLVNALAGGGTLITFPALLAAGLPAVTANVTNSMALVPGFFGATLAQRRDLAGQGARMRVLLPACAAGGILGAGVLLLTGEQIFRAIVPWLILLAAGLLAAQEPLRAWIIRRMEERPAHHADRAAAVPVGAAAVYGGYFGAGMSVIVLAVLGLVLDDELPRLNALKQAIAFTVNAAASAVFLFSGRVVWPAALTMMVGAAAGGWLGGRVAGRVSPAHLRWIVAALGFAIGLVYLFRG